MKFIKNKKAFTLIELLVVIVVIGILVLLGAPRFTGYTQKAEITRIQHDIKVMEQEVGTVLINQDDDFNKWEDNNKDLNQLIQEGKLFEKEGVVVEDVEPIDGSYKIIPEKYKDKINTKLKGTFYTNSNGKVYYEHTKPLSGIPTEPEEEPGYSDKEIEDLTNNCDFIPIATADELNSIRSDEKRTYGKGTKWERECEGGLDKKYIQVADIDLSEYSKEEEGWSPIGTLDENAKTESEALDSAFTGTYDGGNYVIKGLEVKGEDKEFQGLFGFTHGATIRNVGLIDNKVTGRNYVGGLAGYAWKSTIENSYATGAVTGTGEYVGGLVGAAIDVITISNSYSTGSVEGSEYVGGLVGDAWRITIENSYATGAVKGTGKYVGGLVGWASSNTISNSHATGSVTGSGNDVGGLVGSANSSNISNSYATGSVTATGTGETRVGGLVGTANKTEISKSYATGAVEGNRFVGGLVGMSYVATKISSSYATGKVAGTEDYVGGLVGYAQTGTIENSYATGSVKGESIVGGLVGETLLGETYIDSAKISNSYATGSVTATGTGETRVGGLVGSAFSVVGKDSPSTNISNSYWDTEKTGQDKSAGGGEGKTTDDMKKADTYSAWGTDVWNVVNGNYPKLR